MKSMIQVFAAILLKACLIGAALADGPFTVQGVRIDASANTAFEAQRAALERGQTIAAQILIERLTLPEDRMQAGLELINAEDAAALIAGLQISNEQRSATRYRGDLSLDFDPRAVSAYLTAQGVPFVQSQSDVLGVIPITITDSGAHSLRGGWRQAWTVSGFENALTPVIAAPENLIAIDAVLGLDEPGLREAMTVLGVDGLMIVTARQSGQSTRASGFMVAFNDQGVLQQEQLPAVAVSGGYGVAARRIVEMREQSWKRASVVRNTERAELEVSILFSSLSEWQSLQSAVAGASLIENARLDALSRTGAAMVLTHRGARQQVMAELSARGAILAEEEGLGWTVRSR